MGTEDIHITLGVDASLSQIASIATHDLDTDTVIEFVKLIDQKMASWDFTARMVECFAKSLRELHTSGEDWVEDESRRAVANLAEFLRQICINPQVKFDANFYTVWTDPKAQPARLNVHDLATVRDLATLMIGKLDG